ncbi:hypothetical protein JTE90_021643 [Oedothorax gibbosus]|uniref:Glycerol kinase 5 n=1 Tax=Oedothorax gibbosus TaxID=931172 RepID=A0AAV6VSE6_9ARAC|nr:hypothetical protein JTE90_021643 [Oedothorax gibbosus]
MSQDVKKIAAKKVVLGVDIGTTNIRCYAYNELAEIIGTAREKINVLEFEDGRHEIEPDVLWVVFQKVIKNCLLDSHLKPEDVSGMGLSTQRSSFLLWNRNSSEPLHNFITWKDRRTEKLCDSWNSSLFVKALRFVAGLLYLLTRKKLFQVASVLKFKPSMVLARLYSIIHNNIKVKEEISKKEVLFGTIDTWLVWKLTGGKVHATDGSNACVTGFFDIFKMEWMTWLLNILRIPTNILPEIKNTSDQFGETLPELFGSSIPICAIVGDQQASLFGSGCLSKNDVNCTMGTGTFLNMNTGLSPKTSTNGVYPLVAWTIPSQTIYMVEICVHDVGTNLSLAQKIGGFTDPRYSSEIAKNISGMDLFFLPSSTLLEISGSNSTGGSTILGLQSTTSREQIVRSILEALGYQVYLLIDAMQSYGVKSAEKLQICGGVSQNEFLLQLIADLLNKPVIRRKNVECSSLGAAFLAGLSCGIWKDIDEILSLELEYDTFHPNTLDAGDCYIQYKKWKHAIYHHTKIPSIL